MTLTRVVLVYNNVLPRTRARMTCIVSSKRRPWRIRYNVIYCFFFIVLIYYNVYFVWVFSSFLYGLVVRIELHLLCSDTRSRPGGGGRNYLFIYYYILIHIVFFPVHIICVPVSRFRSHCPQVGCGSAIVRSDITIYVYNICAVDGDGRWKPSRNGKLRSE